MYFLTDGVIMFIIVKKQTKVYIYFVGGLLMASFDFFTLLYRIKIKILYALSSAYALPAV